MSEAIHAASVRAPARRYVHSVATRLALATSLIMLVVSIALYYLLIEHERYERLRVKREAAVSVATLLAELTSAPVEFADHTAIGESLGYLRSNDEVMAAAVFPLQRDGTFGPALGTLTREQPSTPAPRAPAPQAVGGVTQTPELLEVSHWVRDPSGQRTAAVVVRFSLARENYGFAVLRQRALQISVAVAAALTLLLLMLARVYIIAPLRAVHGAVSELTTGARPSLALKRGRHRLPLDARDEVGDLARGFVTMADSIAKRETAIADQNQQMRLVLGNVGQGFLIVDARCVIEGQHSAALETWFGPVRAGQTLWHYLGAHDRELGEWLELTWSNIGSLGMPLALCLEQLPKTFSADERHYQVDYHPLRGHDDALEKMVIVIDDVTELRRREHAEREQRELVAVFTALVRDRTGFVSLCEEAKALMADVAASKSTPAHLERLHTVKGNAYLFKLLAFADACELTEVHCTRDRRLPSPDDAAFLAHAYAKSVEPLSQFVALDRGQMVQLASRDFAAVVSALEAGASHRAVLEQLARATAEPAEVVFGRFSERLQVLARRLGKCPVRVTWIGGGLSFPRQTFAPLWAAVVHVLRNIADHGLETAWEREQAGKPACANVEIRAHVAGGKLYMIFQDDGRGVDWASVRARAVRRGWASATRADLIAALFAHGFTTLSEGTALSGRGVGLSALANEARELNGTVQLESERGQGTALTIELPSDAVVS